MSALLWIVGGGLFVFGIAIGQVWLMFIGLGFIVGGQMHNQ